MPFILEVAKAVIVDAIERDAQVEMVDFHPYAPRGFWFFGNFGGRQQIWEG
jgi:hypothetical protein